MTVLHTGSNERYSANWDNIFSKKSGKKTATAKSAKASHKPAKKASAKKTAKKKK